MKNLHVKILALTLTLMGVGLCYYKVTALGLPLVPTEKTEVWSVEARIVFEAGQEPIKLKLDIPNKPPGFIVLDEDFVSKNYGLAIGTVGDNRQSQWAVRRAEGRQVIYYRALLYQDESANQQRNESVPEFPEIPVYPEPYGSAVLALLDEVRSESADIATFASALLQRLNDPTPGENVMLIRHELESPEGSVQQIVQVLAGARIPARAVYGLTLQTGMRDGSLEAWLEVHNGDEWLAFNPATGAAGFPEDFLVWRVGGDPLLRLEGGQELAVNFSVTSNLRELVYIAQQRAQSLGSRIMDYSFFSLPVQTQNVYRILLTVPLGAFLVVLMRNFMGIETFGTFMPILIALAFRETELLWGIILFSLLVTLGLSLRFYLEKLKLLLVPRLASVLIIVVLLMAGVTLMSFKLGIDRGLSISLFPMVILAMTIERMSIVWEEHGASNALKQGLGSLLVACLGYVVMNNKLLTHMIFVFPELLLVVLAATLLMGRYTGYRLTELWRFRAALKQRDPA